MSAGLEGAAPEPVTARAEETPERHEEAPRGEGQSRPTRGPIESPPAHLHQEPPAPLAHFEPTPPATETHAPRESKPYVVWSSAPSDRASAGGASTGPEE